MAEERKPSLSAEDKKKVADRLNQVWVGSARNCPICGSNQWTIADDLVTPVLMGPGPQHNVMLGGISYPQIMLVSNNCGYTIFFNAVLLGVVPREAPKENPDGKS